MLFCLAPCSEDASLISSLENELQNLKEEMAQLKTTTVSVALNVLMCMIALEE